MNLLVRTEFLDEDEYQLIILVLYDSTRILISLRRCSFTRLSSWVASPCHTQYNTTKWNTGEAGFQLIWRQVSIYPCSSVEFTIISDVQTILTINTCTSPKILGITQNNVYRSGLKTPTISTAVSMRMTLVKFFILYLPQWQLLDFAIKQEVVIAIKIKNVCNKPSLGWPLEGFEGEFWKSWSVLTTLLAMCGGNKVLLYEAS